jgi:succinyl-CoA synthetase alpha subunit
VRVVGPGALGVIRPDIGLNATYCVPSAIPGRLALIAQSGAVATAVLDFATPLGIGFSTVISLGGGVDVAFGELLDLVLIDPLTDGILLYVEDVGEARSFVSALRAAARTKPVVVLKSGGRWTRRPRLRRMSCSTPRCAARVPYACRRTRNCLPRQGFLRAGEFRRETGLRSCRTDAVPAFWPPMRPRIADFASGR